VALEVDVVVVEAAVVLVAAGILLVGKGRGKVVAKEVAREGKVLAGVTARIKEVLKAAGAKDVPVRALAEQIDGVKVVSSAKEAGDFEAISLLSASLGGVESLRFVLRGFNWLE